MSGRKRWQVHCLGRDPPLAYMSLVQLCKWLLTELTAAVDAMR